MIDRAEGTWPGFPGNPCSRPEGPLPFQCRSGKDPARLPATMWRHLKNFILFLREEKAWWLVPMIVILLLLAAVLVFNSSSVLAPLMYPVR